MKEAAVQRRHNLYRDSIVLTNSDPNLHLLGENPSIDWAGEYGAPEEVDGAEEDGESEESQKRRRMKQVVSMIQVEGSPVLPGESCMEVPGVDGIPEEDGGEEEEEEDATASQSDKPTETQNGASPAKTQENPLTLTNGTVPKEVEAKPEEQEKEVPSAAESATENSSSTPSTSEEADNSVQGEDSQPVVVVEEDKHTAEEQLPPPPVDQEVTTASEEVLLPPPPPEEIQAEATETEQGPASVPESQPEATKDFPPPPPHDDSGFQSPTNEEVEAEEEAAEAPQTAEGHPEVGEASVATAPETEPKASDSEIEGH